MHARTHAHTPNTAHTRAHTHAHTQFKDVTMSSSPKSLLAQTIVRLENFASLFMGSSRKQTKQVGVCMVITALVSRYLVRISLVS